MNIKEQAPNLVSPESIMADRIASIAVPSSSGTIWDSLKEIYSGGVPVPTSGGLGARVVTPKSTRTLQSLQLKLAGTENRSELAKRTGLRLPNLNYIPKAGIATSPGMKAKYGSGGIEEAVDGGIGDAAMSGDTRYVDDQGWDVTLKQILGSRLLTTEMMEKASIQNVRNLINVRGGTADQNAEMQFMFQRMMLEGFIRGVDITKELERQGGLDITIGKYETIGVHKYVNGQPTVIFKDSWWNSKGDADKYTLFLHEVGHSLLNAHHENDRSKKKKDSSRIMTPIYAGSILRNYEDLMDGLFEESASINRISVQDNGAASWYDKSWFPAISGESEGTLGAPSDTTVTKKGEESALTGQQRTSHTIGGGSDTQGTIQAGTVTQGGAISGTPIVGAALSGDIQTATKTFAAGMADLSKSGPDMSSAGMLLKSG